MTARRLVPGRIFLAVLLAMASYGGQAKAELLIGVAGPMTGTNAWYGEQMQQGVELAIADINRAGGLLGQQLALVVADDFCDPDQAVVAAQKLVKRGAVLVVGHFCSGASIAASSIYEAAGIIEITPVSSNPKLTELGRTNVFRIVPRDDASGILAGNYVVDHWPGQKIAVIHDNTTFGKGWADETRKQLISRGLSDVIFQSFEPGKDDYSAEVAALQSVGVGVLLIGGYHTEVALMVRAAGDLHFPLKVITGVTLATEEFGLIAGAAAEGTLFIDPPDPRRRKEAAEIVERFRAKGFEPEGYTLYSYGAVQVWDQAVSKSRSVEMTAVGNALRSNQFDTLLGPLNFNAKGDLTVQNPILYVWRGGTYQPLEP